MTTESWPYPAGDRFRMTFAGLRSEVAEEATENDCDASNWDIGQRFAREQSGLVTRQALYGLMELYADKLARVRDQGGTHGRFRHPVRDARALDQYLLGDGLDAATVAPDVGELCNDLRAFKWDMQEYALDTEHLPEGFPSRPQNGYLDILAGTLQNWAAQLDRDAENTIDNIRSSAELRQSIASTRLQRAVLILTLAAVVIAIVGLLSN